jgi:hypothetical protein
MTEKITVRCTTCGWSSTSRDAAWTRHAGKVHAEILKPGHVVTENPSVEMLQHGLRCFIACSCETHCPRYEGQVECDPPCCYEAAVRQRDAAPNPIQRQCRGFDAYGIRCTNPDGHDGEHFCAGWDE